MIMMTDRDIQETSQLLAAIQMMDREDRRCVQGFVAGMRLKAEMAAKATDPAQAR